MLKNLDKYLDNTLFPDIDNYHVIARNAWGKLYLWGEKTGDSLYITPHLNWISTKKGSKKEIEKGLTNQELESFFNLKIQNMWILREKMINSYLNAHLKD